MNLPNNTLLQGGKYKIIRFISSGGFGCTYEAEHVLLQKRVAIKEFFVKDFCNRDETTSHVTVGTQTKVALVAKLRKKFLDEAVGLSKLHHEGIVQVTDVFEENGTAYYVMDYINGKSIHEILKTQISLPESKAVKYIVQVAHALQYVHSQNRLHLDIKPGNIMIDEHDNAILIDFGASKQYDEESGENTSTLLGKTPGYAPIEQMGNSVQTFTPATDIYSLGATLYKMLTGVTPPDATILIADDEILKPLPSFITKATRNAVEKAMQIKKKDRPQNINEFLKFREKTQNGYSSPTIFGAIENNEETILDIDDIENGIKNDLVNDKIQNDKSKSGKLNINYKGNWAIWDSTIKIYLDDKHIADCSFKNAWIYTIDLYNSPVNLKFILQMQSLECVFHIDPTENYMCNLTYDGTWGKLHVNIWDSQNKNIYEK